MKIVGVTKCPTGIAHTYMAAERLEKTAAKLGYEIKVETQGSQGTENKLTRKEIARADYVIIAADVSIDEPERFNGKKVFKTRIKPVLKNTENIFERLEEEYFIMGGTDAAQECDLKDSDAENAGNMIEYSDKKESADILGQLMNGASYMIPFVVVGGLLVSLSLSFGATTSPDGEVVFLGIWDKVHQIGALAFTLMYPILAGFIAFSIAGRAALAPAMIGAMVAMNEEILGTKAGTGFMGCIIVGYFVGYLVKWMNSWHVVKEFKPMMPIFIIPLTGVAVVSALFIFVLGKPVTLITDLLNSLLVELAKNPSSAVVLGIVLGAMVGIDMGGPINKVAFFFGVTSIAQGNLQIMGIVSTSIAVAPLSMGIAAVVGKDKFTPEEKSAGIYTIFMGIIGVSEGAIPFAASDPGHVLPAVVAGSALTGAAAAVCGVTSAVPHGGLVVALFKATNYMSLYFLCVMAGTALSIAIVLAFKRRQEKNR